MVVGIIVITCYLLGSIPAGYLIGRLAHVDIREHGSGNIGATNVVRVLGKKYGYPVFACDFCKGIAAVELSYWLATRPQNYIAASVAAILGGLSCIIGHSYPLWLGFRGGKGVATSLGVLLMLQPLTWVITISAWVGIFLLTRTVSLASIVAAAVLPLAAFVVLRAHISDDRLFAYFSLLLAVLVIWRHRPNIIRLLRGDEKPFRRK